MMKIPATGDIIHVAVRRSKQYPERGRSAYFAWKWLYSVTVPEVRLTAANGGLCPGDARDLPWAYSDNSLTTVRAAIRRMAPNAMVTFMWAGDAETATTRFARELAPSKIT